MVREVQGCHSAVSENRKIVSMHGAKHSVNEITTKLDRPNTTHLFERAKGITSPLMLIRLVKRA